MYRLSSIFAKFAIAVLFITGAAKIASLTIASGANHIANNIDPIFQIKFGTLFAIAGVIELAAAIFCLRCREQVLQILTIAAVATGIALYRAGLWLIDYQKPCNCLGSMSDVIGLSGETADLTMMIILLVLLGGSYTILGVNSAVLLRGEKCAKFEEVP